MIEFRNVSKSYWTGKSRKVILDQASFRIDVGRSLGILAPNGTGKSTIINMMSGIEKPDEGEIIRQGRISFPLRGGLSGVNAKLSAQENARYIARLYGMEPDYVESFCRYLIDIDEYFEMPVSTFSSGMKSRFMFSLLLALDFEFYLIDEGMPGTMDTEFNRRAAGLMQERLQTTTIILVSHSQKVLEQYCQSAAVLRNGRLYFFERLEDAGQMYEYMDK